MLARQLGWLPGKWRQLRLQHRRGALEAATQSAAPKAVMWVVTLATVTRAAARGAATHMEAAR